jgi:hypothetical protein
VAGRRRRAPVQRAAAFRPSAPTAAGRAPTRAQAVALLCGLVLVAAGITAVSYLVKPSKARAFQLFYGSVYVDDNTSPVAIDLASGKPTVRLTNAYTAVSAKSGQDTDVYPLGDHNTLLLDPNTGEFNMVDSTGFVVKASNGGVPLPAAPTATTSTAVPAGSSAYILRTTTGSSTPTTSAYLVGAATVSAAVGSDTRVKPRASVTLGQELAADPVPAASANGHLWMLTTSGGTNTSTITELSVPAGSPAGALFSRTSRGTVSGPAAVAVASRNPGGSGGDVPAVADSTEIDLFRYPDTDTPTVRVPVSIGSAVDTILPASNANGALVFLYHSSAGWTRVAVPAAAGRSAQVSALTSIPADARLVVPAQSDGITYTMDTSNGGTFWQIDARGDAQRVRHTGRYPLEATERPELGQAEVVAQGSRVIFNSRGNLQAVVVFSDGSHDPRVINKHSAVQVDPSGATALADAHATRHEHGKTKTKTIKRPVQAINDKVNCNVAKQVPRIPTLVAGDRAARSITVTWLYTRLDPSDCYPSTFVVNIKSLSSGAPSPPSGSVTVQGQNGVTLTGLFPATEYELTVTAYINGIGSTSAPVRVTTGPEGPAAPTGVTASTDSSGNWTVSWKSCGGVKQGCVPSTTWYVIPSFCDGRGLSTVPEKIAVTGDPTLSSFSHVFTGNDSLLGRALCFQVQGISPQGVVGDTSARSAPAFSWTDPDAGALTLTASQPGNVAFGETTSTTVDLDLGADPVRDVGGVGATITLRLSGPDGVKTKTIVWDGRDQRVSTVFNDIRAGAQYSATASVAPPNHAGNAVSKGPVPVTTRAQWPAITAQASCPGGGGAVTVNCTLVVQLSGPDSASANGERFNVVNSDLRCQNRVLGLSASGIDPAHDPITQSIDLLQFNGTCTVEIYLVEAGATGNSPQVFGGTTSPLVSRSVDLGQPTTLGPDDTFAANWTTDPTGYARVKYTGPKTDDQVGQISDGWSEQLLAPDNTVCGTDNEQPTSNGILVPVSNDCVNRYGDLGAGWSVTVSYVDRGTSNQHNRSAALSGAPPGYVPCNVAGSFSANWVSSSDFTSPEVLVQYAGDPGDNLDGCSSWSYQLQHVQNCSAPAGGRPTAGDITLTATCGDDPNLPGWTVTVSWNDPAGRPHTRVLPVQGTPPASPTPTPTDTPPSGGPSPTGS